MISQKYFQIYRPVHVHLKTDEVDFKKSHCEKRIAFFRNSSSRHEKGCQDFFAYFNALETRGVTFMYLKLLLDESLIFPLSQTFVQDFSHVLFWKHFVLKQNK